MGSKETHLKLVKERLKWVERVRSAGDFSVMAELCYKACEQAVQAELATIGDKGIHYREHGDIIRCVKTKYPREVAERFEDLFRLYLEMGYGGVPSMGVPERAYNHTVAILKFVGERLGTDLLEGLRG